LGEQIIEIPEPFPPLERLVGGVNLGQLPVFLFLGALQIGWGDQSIEEKTP
jgi:hypothetical protein